MPATTKGGRSVRRSQRASQLVDRGVGASPPSSPSAGPTDKRKRDAMEEDPEKSRALLERIATEDALLATNVESIRLSEVFARLVAHKKFKVRGPPGGQKEYDWSKIINVLSQRSSASPRWFVQIRSEDLLLEPHGTDGETVDCFIVLECTVPTLSPLHYVVREHPPFSDTEDNAPETIMMLAGQKVCWRRLVLDDGKDINCFILCERPAAAAPPQMGFGGGDDPLGSAETPPARSSWSFKFSKPTTAAGEPAKFGFGAGRVGSHAPQGTPANAETPSRPSGSFPRESGTVTAARASPNPLTTRPAQPVEPVIGPPVPTPKAAAPEGMPPTSASVATEGTSLAQPPTFKFGAGAATSFGFGKKAVEAPSGQGMSTTSSTAAPVKVAAPAAAGFSFGFGKGPANAKVGTPSPSTTAEPTKAPAFSFGRSNSSGSGAPTVSNSFGFGTGQHQQAATYQPKVQKLKPGDIFFTLWSESRLLEMKEELHSGYRIVTEVVLPDYPLEGLSSAKRGPKKLKIAMQNDLHDDADETAKDIILNKIFAKENTDMKALDRWINDMPAYDPKVAGALQKWRVAELCAAAGVRKLTDAGGEVSSNSSDDGGNSSDEEGEESAEMSSIDMESSPEEEDGRTAEFGSFRYFKQQYHKLIADELRRVVAIRKQRVAEQDSRIAEALMLLRERLLAPKHKFRVMKFYPSNDVLRFRPFGKVAGISEAGEHADYCFPPMYVFKNPLLMGNR